MTGAGGWPLNVFLTPEQVPFYAGTYFPPESRMGMPSWRSVLDRGGRCLGRAARGDPHRRRAHRRAPSRRSPAAGLGRAASAGGAGRGGGGAARPVRRGQRRLRRRPQVPAGVGDRVPAAARGDRDVRAHPSGHGLRRHVRPGGRRLRPLLGRPLLARPPLREDALRQRPAGPGLPARLAGHRRAAVPARCASRRSTGPCARCAVPRAASSPPSTPTRRGWRASSTSGASSRCGRPWRASPMPTTPSPGSAPPAAATSRAPTSRCAARARRSGSTTGGGGCTRSAQSGSGPASTTSAWPPGTR